MAELTIVGKGSNGTKNSGTTASISGVKVLSGHSLIVSLGYDDAEGDPISVTHHGRTLRKRISGPSQSGIKSSIWSKAGYSNTVEGDVVATWAGTIGKRVLAATSINVEQRLDATAENDEIADTTPNSSKTGDLVNAGSLVVGTWYEISTVGTTDWTLVGAASNTQGVVFQATGIGSGTGVGRQSLTTLRSFAIAAFVSEGPDADHGSAVKEIQDGGSYATATDGQEEGTSGGADTDNIKITEFYLELIEQNATRARMTGATSRDWTNCLYVIKLRSSFWSQGITPSDMQICEQITIDAGGDPDNNVFDWDEDEGVWVCYENTSRGTERATNEDGTWEAP